VSIRIGGLWCALVLAGAVTGVAAAQNEDGALTVIDTSKTGFPVVQSVETMSGARTMALDAKTGKIYTVSAKLGAPPATPAGGHVRPTALPGTFTVLVIGQK